jgi:predicted TIM-barrel fold metal-dependent hydrolase
MRPNVWIEVSGLPPKKLPDYYNNFDFERLAQRMIFGTDWPGVPSPRANAQAILDLGLGRQTAEKVLYKNALAVYALGREGFDSAPVGTDRDASTT